MGGPSKAETAETKIAEKQTAIADQQYAASQARQGQMDALLKPSIDFNKVIASGDRNAIIGALSPVIGQINASAAATKEAAYDTMTGPARDMALFETEAKKNSDIAGAAGSTYLGAFDKLANIGSGLGSFSLQELGASLTANQQAANNYGQIDQNQTQRKASTMSFLGSLAGAGGSLFSKMIPFGASKAKTPVQYGQTDQGPSD